MVDVNNVKSISFWALSNPKVLALLAKTELLIIFLGVFSMASYGQSYSLKQCIEFANSNNSNLKIANYDASIADKKISEQIGSMLPQVDGSANYTDNLKMSTTLLPGELMGKPAGTYIPITMGTKHNLSTGVSLNQKIFDPTFSVAIKAAKISKKQSEQTIQQTNEQMVYNISKTYYQTLIMQKQANVLTATLYASEKSSSTTEQKYQNGMAKKLDVDKIRVSTNNTRTQLQQCELNYYQSLNTLKYYMGMPVDSSIVLADTALNIEMYQSNAFLIENINVENKVDYQIQQSNISLLEASKKSISAGYLPSLSFSAGYNYNAMSNKFDFFDGSGKWYNSSYVGVSLKVPIFDGLQKRQKVAQSKLNIAKAEEKLKLTEQSLKVDISNYEMQYRNAIGNIHDQKENLDLAQSVYDDTNLQYQQGVSSLLDLVQSESSLREAQNNYFNKLLNLFIARLDLEQSKGTLLNFINNQK